MVVLLSATLPHDGIFFAGEKFTCTLTFTHPLSTFKDDVSQSLEDIQGELQTKKGTAGSASVAMSDMTMNSFEPTSRSASPSHQSVPDTPKLETGRNSITGALKSALGISSFRSVTGSFFGGSQNVTSSSGVSTDDDIGTSHVTNGIDTKSPPISQSIPSIDHESEIASPLPEKNKSEMIQKAMTNRSRKLSEVDSDRSRGIMVTGRRKSSYVGEEISTAQVLDLDVMEDSTRFPGIVNKLELKPSQSFSESTTPGIDRDDSPKKNEGLTPIQEAPEFGEGIEENVHQNESSPQEGLPNGKVYNLQAKVVHSSCGDSVPKQYEELAWGFAQTSGQFVIDPAYIRSSLLDTLKQKVMYRPAGSGSMGPGGGGSIAVGAGAPQSNLSNTFPVLSTPPTILFCDLSIPEGESKSFVYTIDLPAVLPPSHRGKVSRFIYKLIVGVQKVGENLRSQILSIPFRVLNRTNPGGSRILYDVMSPVIITRDEASISDVQTKTSNKTMSAKQIQSQLSPTVSQLSLDDNDETTTQQNIQIVCQLSNRITYDICKNTDHVARVTMPRTNFRLGEIVPIVVDFSSSSIPCYQVSVTLISFEEIDASFSIKSKQHAQSYTRRVHDEAHHFTLNTRRNVVSLVIPTNASCDFQSSLTSVSWSLKLEFITGKYGRFYSASSMYDGFQHQIGFPDVDVEPFDCIIPIKVYGGFKVLTKMNKVFTFDIGN